MPIHDWTRVDAGVFHSFVVGWVSSITKELNTGLLGHDLYSLSEHQEDWIADKFLLGEHLAKITDQAEADQEFYTLKRRSIVVRQSSDDGVVARIEIVSPGFKADQRKLDAFVLKAKKNLACGYHLLLVDVFPPTLKAPKQLHEMILEGVDKNVVQLPRETPLLLASFQAGETIQTFIEPAAVGGSLKPMPLFLRNNLFVNVPLDTTYDAAFAGMPERWRDVLNAPANAPSVT